MFRKCYGYKFSNVNGLAKGITSIPLGFGDELVRQIVRNGTFGILMAKRYATFVKMEEYAKNEWENAMGANFEGGSRRK